jgi:two-component system chemotaxis response regulator CheY
MKMLIVEDDPTSRFVLQRFLEPFGECHLARDGREAVQACASALEARQPFHLICLDVMMPEMDGLTALNQIRAAEEQVGILSHRGAKIIITTVLDDVHHVIDAFYGLCDGYLTKPVELKRLVGLLKDLRLAGTPS